MLCMEGCRLGGHFVEVGDACELQVASRLGMLRADRCTMALGKQLHS